MKIIYKIAKAELRNLFFSPVAWFVIFLFYLTISVIFGKSMEFISNIQESMLDLNSSWMGMESSVSMTLFENVNQTVSQYLYLFIPLLTMGLINREINQGTIRLLYSSPVTTAEIVLGKYLGIVLFNMFLVGIVAIFLLTTSALIPAAEFRMALSIILMYFLLVNTLTAIGLFISSLTNYQIVAAVITFAAFYLLATISGLWQQYDLIRDITYYLALNSKASNLMNCLINSRDITYFPLVIMLFLGYTIIRLKHAQQAVSRTVNASRYVSLTLIVIGIGYFTSRPGYIAYYDATNQQINTLHPSIQKTIKELDGSPLTVTLYTNLFTGNAKHGLPQHRNKYIWEVWERFIRFYPNIEFRYEYYYDGSKNRRAFYNAKYPGKSLSEIAAIEAEMLDIRTSIFKTPEEMHKTIDLSAEDYNLIMQLEYKGKKEFLRTYASPVNPWPTPQHFAATFKRLARDKDVTIAFLTGHYERNIFSWEGREIGWNTQNKHEKKSLINLGVDTDTLSLLHRNIPAGIDALVVADPKSPYSQEEQQKIIDYLDQGGNAIFSAEINKQFILSPILQTIGVYLENGVIVRPDEHEMPHIFRTPLTDTGNYMSQEPGMEIFQRTGRGGVAVQNEGALNLGYQAIKGFSVEPIIAHSGNDKMWIENGILTVDSAPPVFSPAEGDLKKAVYVIGLKLTRKVGNKEQRIVVTGDTDIMSKARGSHSGHLNAFYSWVLYNRYPVYANFPIHEDRFVSISHHKARRLTQLAGFGGSVLLLLAAIILLVRRKRK